MKDLKQMELLGLGVCAEGFHVPIFPSEEQEREYTGNKAGYGLNTEDLSMMYDPIMQSWKTYQRCLIEGWQSYSETWPRSGTMRLGQPSIPNISGCHNVGAEFIFSLSEQESPLIPISSTLQDVVILDAGSGWNISTGTARGILRKAAISKKDLPITLANALTNFLAPD